MLTETHLKKFKIEVHMQTQVFLCAYVKEFVQEKQIQPIPCRSEAIGRLVTITKDIMDHANIIVCEVEIYGTLGMLQCSKENRCMYH